MDYALNEEQEMLRTMARDFLARECPKTYVRAMMADSKGVTAEFWKKIAEVGWPGLALPEKYGGTGMNFRDLAILFEEQGRAMMPGPFFSTVALGALPILNAGTEEQKQEYLPKIASGEITMTMAVVELEGDYWAGGVRMEAYERGGDYILAGSKYFVPDAAAADYIIVAARTKNSANPEDGITLFIVKKDDWGIYVAPLKTMDETRKQYRVDFSRIAVPAKNILGQVDKGWSIVKETLTKGCALLCAEMIAGGEWAMETSAEYAKTRIQFGQPIGTFQAIKIKLADMYSGLDYGRAMMEWAVESIKDGDPVAPLAASMAKAYCGDIYKMVTNHGIQVHGGIGFTWDHDMHLYWKRSRANDTAFGDANYHREQIAKAYD
jgi:alkylation response protein AidB-like acyl-CoA dehydrogenase